MVRPETQRQPSAVVEDKHAAANAELARLLKEPPLTVDCQKLMAELEALERRDPDAKSMLQRGLAKYEYAERAQHASRVKKWTDAIKELMVMPLDVDTVALAAAIKALTALAPADTSILDRGEAALAVESMIAACSVLQPQRLSASSVAALLDWADEGVSSWPHDGERRGRARAYLVCTRGSPVLSCLCCWRAHDAPNLAVASLPQALL
jgi:hypothetical protein